MKFTLACALLLARSSTSDIISSDSQSLDSTYNRVISNHKITHCDTQSFIHSIQSSDSLPTIYGLDCNSDRRRLSPSYSSKTEDLSSQSFAGYEEGAILDVIPNLNEEHLSEVHEVYINFGQDVLNEISSVDLAENVEITVTHSEGTTTKTIPSVADLMDLGDISIGSFNFNNCSPKVTITHTSKTAKGEETTSDKVKSSKVLPFSHASFRRLAGIPASYNWRNSNSACADDVGNQGSCGSCYAWTAVGIANERECRTGKDGSSVRHLACKRSEAHNGVNGGCDGGWVAKSLNYMKSDGVCTKRDVPWPWYCMKDDCITCDGNWAIKGAYNPSCNKDKLDGGQNWKTVWLEGSHIAGKPTVTQTNALKNYLMNTGSFGYSFPVTGGWMWHGSNTGGIFGSKCDGRPFKSGSDGCCKQNRKSEGSWWWKADNSAECNTKDGGHAIRVVGWGTGGEGEYWIIQNSWGTGWADKGFMQVSMYDANYEYQQMTVETTAMRRSLAAEPGFGLDYLLSDPNSDEFGLRFLGDTDPEVDPSMEPGSPIEVSMDSIRKGIAQTAMIKYNCTIVPQDHEHFEESYRADSLDCINQLTNDMVDDVILSKALLAEVLETTTTSETLGGDYPYAEVAKSMAELLYEPTTAADVGGQTVEEKLLNLYLAPIGLGITNLVKSTTKVVNGYVWSMSANAYPVAFGKFSTSSVPIKIESWLAGDLSAQVFNLKLADESEFMDSVTEHEGIRGMAGARHNLEEETIKREERNKPKFGPGAIAGIAVGMAAFGGAIGALVKHKHHEEEKSKLHRSYQEQLKETEMGKGVGF